MNEAASAPDAGRVGLVLDRRFEDHDTGPGHPERPERVASIRRRLEASGLAERCVRIEPEEAPESRIARVHDADYVERVSTACASGPRAIDTEDTVAGPESPEVARLACGSVIALCREVAEGRLDRGFAAVRPPGHHAERNFAMGFCLYGTVAVAARWLLDETDVRRVLIVDWDVHHGNGTQHLLESDPDVFYFSVHQSPLYPGTGAASERGVGAGEGTTLNCPLPPGTGDDAYLATLSGDLAAAADRFRPGFVLVSAGFDPHRRDPLAQFDVSTDAFRRATEIVRGIADRHAGGRLVSALEGGYDLEALAASVEAHVEALLA